MTTTCNTLHRIGACSTNSTALARTRSPVHWYTLRGSRNREVTRVKKDVRVNLARCTLAEMNSFRPFLSASPALFLFLSSSLMDTLSCPSACAPSSFPPFPFLSYIFILPPVDHDSSAVPRRHPPASSSLSMADLTNLENHVSRDVY